MRPYGEIEEQLGELEGIDFFKNNFLLMGDFNGKNVLWGYKINDVRGKAIADFILEKGFTIVNDTSFGPSFVTSRASGNPDLTLVSPGIFPMISKWQILDLESNSDHKYITFLFDQPITYSEDFY